MHLQIEPNFSLKKKLPKPFNFQFRMKRTDVFMYYSVSLV